MPMPTDKSLPPFDDLVVPEIEVSSPVLRATSLYLGMYCDNICKEYMLCKHEEKDPRRCLSEGKQVTACGMEFMKKLKAKCKAEVEAFAKCMEWNSPTLEYRYCRKAQMLFDNCMKEKLQMERPPPNYFNQLRVHNTNRPKPQEDLPKFENPVKGLPDDYPRRDPITNALFV